MSLWLRLKIGLWSLRRIHVLAWFLVWDGFDWLPLILESFFALVSHHGSYSASKLFDWTCIRLLFASMIFHHHDIHLRRLHISIDYRSWCHFSDNVSEIILLFLIFTHKPFLIDELLVTAWFMIIVQTDVHHWLPSRRW